MKALVGTFNQEMALVGAFSVIVKLRVIFGNLRLKLYCVPSSHALRVSAQDTGYQGPGLLGLVAVMTPTTHYGEQSSPLLSRSLAIQHCLRMWLDLWGCIFLSDYLTIYVTINLSNYLPLI